MTRTITVDHLARVEGHGGITVVLDGDHVDRIEFNVFEGIRLFEGLVRGRHFDEVPQIVSRICAICSHGHALTSIRALERALKVEESAQTRKLRDLAFQGANIESHALHVFALALPDLVDHPSVISLAGVMPEAVRLALRLKKLGNSIQEVVGGRAVHPVNYLVGGFGSLPGYDALISLKRALEVGLRDCVTVRDVLGGIPFPDFVSEPVRCAALVPDDDCFFFGDTVRVTDGTDISVADYRKLTNEHLVPHSHAKHSAHEGRGYMVGALARLTLHGNRIGGLAREVWEYLGLEVPTQNIVMNNLAQAVELVYSVERAHALVTEMLERGLRPEPTAPCRARASQGAAASEVPRGVLFHSYRLDDQGRVVEADVITPTAQNFTHAEEQLRATVRDGIEDGDQVLKHRLEIVARAYDPCISCSVHVVRAE